MKLIEQTFVEPAENIAFDEALLLDAELMDSQDGYGFLRVWEPSQVLVIVGRGSAVAQEVDLARCENDGVPIFRRSSGGAAIVTGPGCLMYAVVLPYEHYPALRAIDEAHQFVLSKIVAAINEVAPGIEYRGISDLAVAGKKVSGNALRCARNHLLYHGTLLYDMPLENIASYLHIPPRQPAYRKGRTHVDFVANISISREALQDAVVSAWEITSSCAHWPPERTRQMVAEKYACKNWTMKIP